MEIRQFSRLAAKYARAQTVFMIGADLYLFGKISMAQG